MYVRRNLDIGTQRASTRVGRFALNRMPSPLPRRGADNFIAMFMTNGVFDRVIWLRWVPRQRQQPSLFDGAAIAIWLPRELWPGAYATQYMEPVAGGDCYVRWGYDRRGRFCVDDPRWYSQDTRICKRKKMQQARRRPASESLWMRMRSAVQRSARSSHSRENNQHCFVLMCPFCARQAVNIFHRTVTLEQVVCLPLLLPAAEPRRLTMRAQAIGLAEGRRVEPEPLPYTR
jgi:hypothetical protein